MQYTTHHQYRIEQTRLFYQDFKDTFVCNTQHIFGACPLPLGCFIRISKILLYAIHNSIGKRENDHLVVLSGFQRYFCMQYTTIEREPINRKRLFYQDFKDTFVCNTQLGLVSVRCRFGCFIRISKILLYAIHNCAPALERGRPVVLSGFQRYFCMQYTTMI